MFASISTNMFVRRLTTTHVIAAVAILVFLSILVRQTSRSASILAGTRFAVSARNSDGILLDDINNSTLGFGKILVVGMPSRTDRRDGIALGAALSNMEIEFIDSTDGTAVPDKALPTMGDHGRLPNPVIGSWRGHMDALREVVRKNLSSALIMEDDVDWDVRIRQQLQKFARASRGLTQPIDGSPGIYLDRERKRTRDLPPRDFDFDKLPKTLDPSISPYGDDWDVLWLGHCGQMFPSEDGGVVPRSRVVQNEDWTVAQKQYLGSVLRPFEYLEQYPDHSRVVHHVQDGVCSLAYAVSQRGARAMLYEIGLKDLNAAFDLLLHWSCSGENGRGYHQCLTVQPPLIQHHRPAGPKSRDSDISSHGDGVTEKARTEEIRWSVRMNAEVLLRGGTEFVDQYPDE